MLKQKQITAIFKIDQDTYFFFSPKHHLEEVLYH